MINKIGNIFMKPLLSSFLHFLASGQIVLIRFQGRKSGKIYDTPVEYRQEGDTLTFFTQKSRLWWKNLQGDDTCVELRLRGKKVTARQQLISDDPEQIVREIRLLHPRMTLEQAEQLAPSVVMIQLKLLP
ncbi:MAG: nitroreductase/quinone reductase family protein [Anaerolineae bacterium]|nr:nitroreductase/quinone reductase family protein [Anaerolineae bacterium]